MNEIIQKVSALLQGVVRCMESGTLCATRPYS